MALQELIYTSVPSALGDTEEVRNILAASERNNAATAITGLLMCDGQRFIQILEGKAENVERLYAVIAQDPRHEQLELLHKGSVSGRSFDNWRMAYEALPPKLLEALAEKMAVFSMELNGDELKAGESFGAKLNAMFMDALAAE